MNINKVLADPGGISIDSRTIKRGEIFIALKGKNFDGHDFVKKALSKGAKAAIVSRIPDTGPQNKKRLIKVKDTLKTLGDIACAHRKKYTVPVVAVTGSNGKTTTKDMIAHMLSTKYKVLKNETSKNNLIGLPLTLLKLTEKHDVAVLEMGMNKFGEIARLSEIAKPHIGVVTNIGPSHLEFLGTVKNILMAKMELIERLTKYDIAVLNNDDIYLRNLKWSKCRRIYFGIKRKCEFQAEDLLYKNNKWQFSIDNNPLLQLPVLGHHNIYNALAAIAIARQFNLKYNSIRSQLRTYRQSSRMRLELKSIKGIEIIDDSYNANPASMKSAINTLSRYDARGKRILVAGDMLELGKKSKAMHKSIGKMVASAPVKALITIGEFSSFISRAAKKCGMNKTYHAQSHEEAARILQRLARPGDVILLKGSRGMQMEKIIWEFRGKH